MQPPARVETKMLKEGMARKGWRGRRDREIVVKARTGVKVAIGSNTRLAVAEFSLMSTWFPGRSSSDVWIPKEEGQDDVYRKRQEGDDDFRKKGSVVKVSRCRKMEKPENTVLVQYHESQEWRVNNRERKNRRNEKGRWPDRTQQPRPWRP